MRKLTNVELRKTAEARVQKNNTFKKEIYLVLDNLRSVYNIGAIFRTADAAKIKKLYLCGICAHPPRQDLEKTALKTIPYVNWQYLKSSLRLIKKLKNNGLKIVALEQTDQSVDYRTIQYEGPMVLVVGNETDGISQKVIDLCDLSVEIPQHGFANSLNVTTATGIVLFHLL